MLSRTLRMFRLNSRLTQQEVANLLNVDRSTYTYYETGKTKPDLDTLMKLCCIFDTSLDTLTRELNSCAYTIRETVDEYLNTGEQSQSFCRLDKKEQRAVMLFRICPDKDKALKILEELSVGRKLYDRSETQRDLK
ncbi:MAG: helix-turn-helix transcriptional regulator [Clostridiales bacterium]|mgnify:CR=1 FL=1|nr:helix-turn-helix transcriptional regulator [Clostridiales bacterium]